jgi:hypothetical protein
MGGEGLEDFDKRELDRGAVFDRRELERDGLWLMPGFNGDLGQPAALRCVCSRNGTGVLMGTSHQH